MIMNIFEGIEIKLRKKNKTKDGRQKQKNINMSK